MAKGTTKCKVRILCPLPEVYPKYQPKVGEVYEAEYRLARYWKCGKAISPVCVIKVLDKKICLRRGEYEILKGN